MLITKLVVFCIIFFLYTMFEVHGLSVTQVASDRKICPDGWTLDRNIGNGTCYRIYYNQLTWEEARAKCREDLGFLLKVNGTLASHMQNILNRKVEFGELWTGIFIQPETGRLIWDGLVPEIAVYQDQIDISWSRSGQPNPANGAACGKIRRVQLPDLPPTFEMSLHNCSKVLPFICHRDAVTLKVTSDAPGCIQYWYGDTYHDQCYRKLAAEKAQSEYIRAKGECNRILGGPNQQPSQLPQPKTSYDEHFFNQFLKTITQTTDGTRRVTQMFQLGWTSNITGSVLWSDGTPVLLNRVGSGLRSLINKREQLSRFPGMNCSVATVTEVQTLDIVWSWSNCTSGAPFHVVCQHPQHLPNPVSANFTVRSSSSEDIKSQKSGDRIMPIFINQSVMMQFKCRSSGYTSIPRVFMKDWLPIPAAQYFAERREFMQGLYWCEAWQKRPFKRIQSNMVLAVSADVLTYRCRLDLPIPYLSPNSINNFNLFGVKDFNVQLIAQFFNESLSTMLSKRFGWYQGVYLRLSNLTSTDPFERMEFQQPSVAAHFDAYIDVVPRIERRQFDEHHGRLNLTRDLRTLLLQNITAIRDALRRLAQGNDFPIEYNGRDLADSLVVYPTTYCPDQKFPANDNGLSIKIASGPQGHTFNSKQRCPSDNKPLATAYCTGNFYTGLHWEIRTRYICPDLKKSVLTDKLRELSQKKVTSMTAYDIASSVAAFSRNVTELVSQDIILISNIVEKLVSQDSVHPQTGFLVCMTIHNIMGANSEQLMEADKIDGSSNRFIQSLDMYTDRADLRHQNTLRQTYRNLAVEMWDLGPGMTVTGIRSSRVDMDTGTKPHGGDFPWFSNQSLVSVSDSDDDDDDDDDDTDNIDDIDVAIFLPSSLIEDKVSTSPPGENVRLSFIIQRQIALFERQNSNPNFTVNSRIISATLGSQPIRHLSSDNRIRVVFYPIANVTGDAQSAIPRCVFWDFRMNNRTGAWSQDGCELISKVDSDGHYECLCDHLTNFAVLIDYGGEKLSELDEKILTIITIIGLSLSIIGLSLTILSFLMFRKLRKGRTQKTLFNLALALLAAWVLFLIGIILSERSLHKGVGCQIVAILLHYFLLAGFMWMLVEAVLQYLRFVKVLGTYMERFMLKAILIAWGVPVIPVIVVLAIDHQLYLRHDDITRFCWLDVYTSYFAFLLPVGLIILVNSVVFIMIVWAITHRPRGLQSNQSKSKEARISLQAGIACFILLGLTWIFGYLAIQDARVVFQYLFTILNSFHGFFIFLFFTLREKQVRQQWKTFCCKSSDDRKKAYTSSELSSTQKRGSNDMSSNITTDTVVPNGKFTRINSGGESVLTDRKNSGQGGDMFFVNDGQNKFKRIDSGEGVVKLGERDTKFTGTPGHVAYLNNGFNK